MICGQVGKPVDKHHVRLEVHTVCGSPTGWSAPVIPRPHRLGQATASSGTSPANIQPSSIFLGVE